VSKCLIFALIAVVCVFPAYAQQDGQKPFEMGDLVDLGDTIHGYFLKTDATGENPTWEGLGEAIREKYRKLVKTLNAFEDRSSVRVDVLTDGDQIRFEIAFHIEKVNQIPAGNLDFSKLSPRFRKGPEIPVKLEITFDGAYRLRLTDVGDMSNISSSEALRSQFLEYDHLTVDFVANGNDNSSGREPDLRLFPGGLTPQVFVAGGLDLAAETRSIAYVAHLWYVWTGGRGQGVFSADELLSKNFTVTMLQSATIEGQFTVSHKDAAGSLALKARLEQTPEKNETSLQLDGDLVFPALRLGDQLSLTDATLSFQGSPDRASIRGTARRGDIAVRVEGAYDFAAATFNGSAGAVPMSFSGALSAPEAQ
jgi:hypothetical protein